MAGGGTSAPSVQHPFACLSAPTTCSILPSPTIVGNGLRSWVDLTCLGGQADLTERQGAGTSEGVKRASGPAPTHLVVCRRRAPEAAESWSAERFTGSVTRGEGLQLLGGAGEEVRRPHGPFDGKGVLEAPSRLGPATEQAAEGT